MRVVCFYFSRPAPRAFLFYSCCKLDLDSNVTRVSKCNVNFEAVEGPLKTELRGRREQHKVVKRKALEKLLTLG